MTRWYECPFTAFDIESTGVDVENDRIVTASVVSVLPRDTPPWEARVEQWVANPGVEIPAEATAVHGITNEYVQRHGSPAEWVVKDVVEALGWAVKAGFPIVVMNGAYDFTLLDRECQRHGLLTVEEVTAQPLRPVIDIYVLDKQLYPRRRGSRKLVDLCRHYDVKIDGAHDSGVDALASARIAYRQARRHPEIGDADVFDLHQRQVGWRAQQCDSLRAYFDRKGIEHDGVDPSWPYKPRAVTG